MDNVMTSMAVEDKDYSHLHIALIPTRRQMMCNHCGLETQLVIEVKVNLNTAEVENLRYKCNHCGMGV